MTVIHSKPPLDDVSYDVFNTVHAICENDGHIQISDNDEQGSNRDDCINDDINDLKLLTPFYCMNKSNLKFAHLNVNSVRHKFDPLAEALKHSMLDVLMLQETKLDDSFPLGQFSVPNFKLYRKDVTSNSGGLMMYVRGDLPQRRRSELEVYEAESGRIELLIIELVLNNEKWLCCSIYKQPDVKDVHIVAILESLINKCLKECTGFIMMGDFNVDVSKTNHCLTNVFEIHGVKNIVNTPTCFKNFASPSTIDLVVTNVPKRIKQTVCIDTGLSDFHNMVCFSTRMNVKPLKPKHIIYRSYKNFDNDKYVQDLGRVPFQVAEIFDSIDDSYWLCQELIKDVINDHAPLKQRVLKHKQVPYMNSVLRKSINARNMLRRRYDKCTTAVNWEKYRVQRNRVTKLRKESKTKYMKDKCTSVSNNNKDFWKMVKPLMSNKTKGADTDIVLFNNKTVISDPVKASNIFNEYFVNVAASIGKSDEITGQETFNDIVEAHDGHESVRYIQQHLSMKDVLTFSSVSEKHVYKKLRRLDVKKATGFDAIPPKLIKIAADCLCKPVTYLINMCIKTSKFPEMLKYAEVSPIYKKDDPLDKKNYRPISVLPCLSKVFESVIIDQMSEFFDRIASPYMSGFRKSHNCQSVLLRFVEKCKTAIDNNMVYGAVLTDLSKAFDCLPHRLVVSKLRAYGLSEDSCMLIANYFTGRKQRVKIGGNRGEWMTLLKGAPQGSIFGPFIFNLFQNDLLFRIEKLSDIFNYADDNTVGYCAESVQEVNRALQQATKEMLSWFEINYMQANPAKFQFIVFDKMLSACSLTIKDEVMLQSQGSVKLLGLLIDVKLSFSEHISIICSKAGKQISALARISRDLDVNTKLMLFQSFILCQFNFCPIVWHFCSLKDSQKIEKVQHRALKFVFNDFTSSYSELRERANRPLMYVERLRRMMIEMFKICNKNEPVYNHNLFVFSENTYSMRNNMALVQPKCNSVKYGINSLRYQGAKLWNNLDFSFESDTSLDDFIKCISRWNGIKCKCSFCSACVLQRM